jgi:HD-GYP domain-containing protein (c-di-GMP phosphodiesterase class II)
MQGLRVMLSYLGTRPKAQAGTGQSRGLHKEAWPLEHVLETLREPAGTHFGPRLVAIFISILPRILEIREVWEDGNSLRDAEILQLSEQSLATASGSVI